ncbi:MAG: TolC family protein, partial [Candidatus Binataceae bacterium]
MRAGHIKLDELRRWPGARAARRSIFALYAAALALTMGGCGEIARLPELAPDTYVASSVERQWSPPSAAPSYAPGATVGAQLAAAPPARDERDAPYSLAGLIDLALTHNPDTRVAWEQARAQAAAWGRVRAEYYPKVATETDFEYSRTIFQIGGGNGRIKTAQITPMVELTYTLLDFGRRRASSDAAREQLAAANFSFNRKMQEVVFNTQR